MTALVTGASGFIGGVLCRELESHGVGVRAATRGEVGGPWSEMVRADLAAAPLPEGVMEGVETVFHLAAYTHAVDERGHEDRYRRINVEATRRLLEQAARARVERFVFFSSVKAMGEGAEEPLDETGRPAPTTAYGRTKLEAERLVLGGGYVNHPAVLRLVPVYGPGAKGNIPRMIAAIARRRFPPVPDVGGKRSLVHVDDVVAAARIVERAADASGRVFIVTDGQRYSLRDLYESICGALGRRPGPPIPGSMFALLARVGDLVGAVSGRRVPYDSTAHRKLFGSAVYRNEALMRLGYRPGITFAAALPAMIESMGLSRPIREGV